MRDVDFTITLDVFGALCLLPLIEAAAILCGAGSFVAWLFIALLAAFVLLNVSSLLATIYCRKNIASRPAPPASGFRTAIMGVLVWSVLFAVLWVSGWMIIAAVAGVGLISLIAGVSLARGRARVKAEASIS